MLFGVKVAPLPVTATRAETTMNRDSASLRVGISGSYGGLNLGDEAILGSMVAQLRASEPELEITVFSLDPEDTLERHDVDRAVKVRELTREESRAEVSRLDLFVLGGGGILYDRDIEVFLREVALAHEAGVPVAVSGVSAGPVDKEGSRKLLRQHLDRVALLTVRDRQGQKLLEECGVEREIAVTADPALLLAPEDVAQETLEREGVQGGHRLVAMSVREPGPAAPDLDVAHYHALLANAADFMVDRFDAEIVFVPMERAKQDLQHSHAVVAEMELARRATVLKGKYSPGQLLSLFEHFDFALGMRLHFLIFAALQGVPLVALPYASKVAGLVEELGMEMPPLHQVTTGRLIAHIDRSWDRQGELRDLIAERLPGLQERARRNHDLLISLVRSLRSAVAR
jgi:polysaccharide pyruvyl transferase CsaB